MNTLFLYTEISGYFLACAETFAAKSGAVVHVVRWKVNAEAPFVFTERKGIVFHERSQLDDNALLKLCESLKPALVYVAGRVDKGYLKAAKQLKKRRIPVIFGFDNHWTGSFRQRAAGLLSRLLIRNKFTHAWVPGKPQYPLALKLGFPKEKILSGVYAGDISPFLAEEEKHRDAKAKAWPHTLLFCGRLVESKGVAELTEAFLSLPDEIRKDWKLMLAGTGPLADQMPRNENIILKGFVQPEELPALVAHAGAFVLPSRFEPWGVALHEFAAGGLPLIASEAVGAATAFLQKGENGFSFPPGDGRALRNALSLLCSQTDERLRSMGQISRSLSLQLTPDTWADTLIRLIK